MNIKLMTDQELEKSRAEWVNFTTTSTDIFHRSYCGYWLHGYEHVAGFGWLAHDDEAGGSEERAAGEGVLKHFKQYRALPKNWYRIDDIEMGKAFDIGVRLWGERWFEEGVGERYDIVVQLALLGEVRYG